MTDEQLVKCDNDQRRMFQAAMNREETSYDRLLREARERHQRSLADARERLRAKGIDPDTL